MKAGSPGLPDPGLPDLPRDAAAAPRPGTSFLAIAALVLGIVGFLTACFLVGVPIGLVALVLGIVAAARIGKPGRPAGGMGMAIAGIVLGAVTSVGGLLVVVPMGVGIMLPALGAARRTAQQMETSTNARTLAAALLAARQDPAVSTPTDPGELLGGGFLADASAFLSPAADVSELPADFAGRTADEQVAFVRAHASLIPVPLPPDAEGGEILVFSVPGLWSYAGGFDALHESGEGPPAVRFTVATADGAAIFETDGASVEENVLRTTGRTLKEIEAAFRAGN